MSSLVGRKKPPSMRAASPSTRKRAVSFWVEEAAPDRCTTSPMASRPGRLLSPPRYWQIGGQIFRQTWTSPVSRCKVMPSELEKLVDRHWVQQIDAQFPCMSCTIHVPACLRRIMLDFLNFAVGASRIPLTVSLTQRICGSTMVWEAAKARRIARRNAIAGAGKASHEEPTWPRTSA